MNLYNTRTRSIQKLITLTPGAVKMYSCGPTVYDSIHIGNLRAFTFADLLKRALIFNGYTVRHIMNITDFGHLVGDGDDGEDKMSVGLRREGFERTLLGMKQLADKYSQIFLDDTRKLNMLPADIYPRAIEHISEYIEIIKKLEDKGFIYITSDGVYFDTAQDLHYGEMALISRSKDSESRLAENSEKKNERDFALWKFANEDGQKNGIGFESPWGFGFPGWHIECSGMAWKYLGESFDIHTGGVDHIAVHHTNEIAQSENAHGAPYASFFCHNEFLNIGEEKMSKSKGNVYTLRDIEAKGIALLAFRYFLLQSHYRQNANFTWAALEAAQNAFSKLEKIIIDLKEQSLAETAAEPSEFYITKFREVVNDDLSIPAALALLWEMLKDEELKAPQKYATALLFDSVLGLGLANMQKNVKEFTQEEKEIIEKLLVEREELRKAKNWDAADKIRTQLQDLGYDVMDK